MGKSYLIMSCGGIAMALAPVPAVAEEDVSAQLEMIELHVGEGEEHFTLDGRITAGGAPNQFVLRFSGGSDVGPRVDNVEIRALYGRSLSDDITLMAGVRQDFRSGNDLTHGTVGIEAGLTPWLGSEVYGFVSEDGDATAEAELVGSFALNERTTLEPRVGIGFALQDIPVEETASGFTDVEASFRLRYTLFGNTNAYVGAIHERLLGDTRDLAEANGDRGAINRVIVGFATSF